MTSEIPHNKAVANILDPRELMFGVANRYVGRTKPAPPKVDTVVISPGISGEKPE